MLPEGYVDDLLQERPEIYAAAGVFREIEPERLGALIAGVYVLVQDAITLSSGNLRNSGVMSAEEIRAREHAARAGASLFRDSLARITSSAIETSAAEQATYDLLHEREESIKKMGSA